jgi:hypothetical protein
LFPKRESGLMLFTLGISARCSRPARRVPLIAKERSETAPFVISNPKKALFLDLHQGW